MELGIYVLRATVFLVTSKGKEESNIFWAKYNQRKKECSVKHKTSHITKISYFMKPINSEKEHQ